MKKKSIEKNVNGAGPFRVGYVTKLWRDKNGKLHVIDGHLRVGTGQDHAFGIMDEAAYNCLAGQCG